MLHIKNSTDDDDNAFDIFVDVPTTIDKRSWTKNQSTVDFSSRL